MPNRKQRAEIAQATVDILTSESYSIDGNEISISAPIELMSDGTTLYTPSDLESLLNSLLPAQGITKIEVVNCTTFSAAKSLIDRNYPNPLCLNFASAKNPGGGFLSGSQAQEECLARASGLYRSISSQMTYYEANRSHSSSLYTNHIIYSPSVPVFRNDDDILIDRPYAVSIVTSPAVNASAIRKNEPEAISQIEPIMRQRINSVLAVARKHQHQAIVLGAWGCGVFGNDPLLVARWFADALHTDSRFCGAFDRVVFAVLDFADGTPTFASFDRVFKEN